MQELRPLIEARFPQYCVMSGIKNGDAYLVVYPFTLDGYREARNAVVRWAADPELPFTWYDAARMLDAMVPP